MYKNPCPPIVHVGFIICLISFLVLQIRDVIVSRIWDVSIKASPTNASSMWCFVNNGGGKMCKFRNLYYIPAQNQFLFLLSSESVIHGVYEHPDLMQIELSSVLFHNSFLMNLAMVSDKDNIFHRNIAFEDKVFIMRRFKRDNIMHVIHDDLMPLHETYSKICTGDVDDCVSQYSLAFADEGDLGPYAEWYNIFSNKNPILLHQGNNSIMCFQEAFAGIDRSTIWFQYGFNMPQGPVIQPKIGFNQIHRFTDYVYRKFGINVPPPDLKRKLESTAVLFSRKINRKILNEDNIVLVTNDIYRKVYSKENSLRLFNTDLSLNDTRSILSVLSQADFVIGMHGSAMILTMFAKPGTAVLELFPYGIKPEVVSPLRALCQIQGIGLLYDSWRNLARDKSVVHPYAEPLLGGIHHLTVEQQEEIENTAEVPAVACCHNPMYLYRMYQDTWINLSEFSSILNALLLKQRKFSIQSFWNDLQNKTFSHWYFPAPVSNIHCKVKDDRLRILWTVPVNVKNGLYDITVIMENGPQIASRTSLPEFTMDISDKIKQETKVSVWVKCIVNLRESHDTYKECRIGL